MAAPVIAVANLALGVVSSLFGGSAKRKAAKKAERLGGLNADYIGEETAEQKRRLGFEQSQTRATTRTNIAASGFRSGADSMGASHQTYLKTMKTQQKSEMDWLSKSGKSRSQIAREGGDIEAAQLRASAFGDYARAGQGLFGIYSEIKNG